ncbi:hypothetical protein Ctob_007594, partial [Chrysochromulina tobinii]
MSAELAELRARLAAAETEVKEVRRTESESQRQVDGLHRELEALRTQADDEAALREATLRMQVAANVLLSPGAESEAASPGAESEAASP